MNPNSAEGLKARIQEGPVQTSKPVEVATGSTGAAAAGSKDRPILNEKDTTQTVTHSSVRRRVEDTITHMITLKDEESLIKLLMTWQKDTLKEKVVDFMEYNQTGIDATEVVNFYKISGFPEGQRLN